MLDLLQSGGEHVYPAKVIHNTDDVLWVSTETNTIVWTGAELGYVIQVWYDDDFLQMYQYGDKALLAATQGLDPMTWRGPMMACCASRSTKGVMTGDVKMLDMDSRAYSHLTSFMVSHYNTTNMHAFNRGPKVQCVEMAGGQGGEITEAHRLVHMPRTYSMFQGQSALSEVSKVCLPLS